MAVGTVDARLQKDKGGGKCYDKATSGDPNISAEGRESIQSLISFGKEASFPFNPTKSQPLLKDCISAFGHAHQAFYTLEC